MLSTTSAKRDVSDVEMQQIRRSDFVNHPGADVSVEKSGGEVNVPLRTVDAIVVQFRSDLIFSQFSCTPEKSRSYRE